MRSTCSYFDVNVFSHSPRRRFFACCFGPVGLHSGHPLGLLLVVRWYSFARHSYEHLPHFHSALYIDPFVTAVGGLSLSTYSRDSFSPSSPFFSHHVRKLFVLLAGAVCAHCGHPEGLSLFVRSFTCARHTCLHFKHFHFAL